MIWWRLSLKRGLGAGRDRGQPLLRGAETWVPPESRGPGWAGESGSGWLAGVPGGCWCPGRHPRAVPGVILGVPVILGEIPGVVPGVIPRCW